MDIIVAHSLVWGDKWLIKIDEKQTGTMYTEMHK